MEDERLRRFGGQCCYAVERGENRYAVFESIPELVESIFPILSDFDSGKYGVIKFFKWPNDSPNPAYYTPTDSQPIDPVTAETLIVLHDYINVIDISPPSDYQLWCELIENYGFVESMIVMVELYDPEMY